MPPHAFPLTRAPFASRAQHGAELQSAQRHAEAKHAFEAGAALAAEVGDVAAAQELRTRARQAADNERLQLQAQALAAQAMAAMQSEQSAMGAATAPCARTSRAPQC